MLCALKYLRILMQVHNLFPFQTLPDLTVQLFVRILVPKAKSFTCKRLTR